MRISFVQCLLSMTEGRPLGHSTIDTPSDDVHLCIFDSYRRNSERSPGAWPWYDLVHVCQRWRGFPHCPRLYLTCESSKTEVEAMLNVWPALPLMQISCSAHIPISKIQIQTTLPAHWNTAIALLRSMLGGFNRFWLEKCMGIDAETVSCSEISSS